MTLILATATLYLSAAEEGAAKKCDNPEPMTPFDMDKVIYICKEYIYNIHYQGKYVYVLKLSMLIIIN